MARSGRLPAAVLCAFAAAAGAATPAPDGMQRLRAFIEHAQTLKADFRQEIVGADDEVIEASDGKLVLKRPGRFRFDYEKPFTRVVVADGERVSLYEADLAQVTVRPLAAGLGETPAALLTGERGILERFESAGTWSADGLAWVRLKPRAADADFDSVAIGFRADTPVELDLADRLGQRTRVHLASVRLNAAVPDETFRLTVPDGVDVIREGEL